jgi:hypothetical protein
MTGENFKTTTDMLPLKPKINKRDFSLFWKTEGSNQSLTWFIRRQPKWQQTMEK